MQSTQLGEFSCEFARVMYWYLCLSRQKRFRGLPRYRRGGEGRHGFSDWGEIANKRQIDPRCSFIATFYLSAGKKCMGTTDAGIKETILRAKCNKNTGENAMETEGRRDVEFTRTTARDRIVSLISGERGRREGKNHWYRGRSEKENRHRCIQFTRIVPCQRWNPKLWTPLEYRMRNGKKRGGTNVKGRDANK